MAHFRLSIATLLPLLCISCAKVIESQRLKPITNHCDLQKLSKQPSKELLEAFETPKTIPKRKELPKLDTAFMQPVTINIAPETNLREMLCSITQPLGINVHICPKCDNGIYYTANKKRFVDVLEDICDSMNWRYHITARDVRIEEDTPYYKNYAVSFLKFARDSENKISSSTDVFKDANDQSTLTQDNGSASVVSVKSSIDFWGELEEGIKFILTDDAKCTFHKQGGVVGIFGNSKQHKAVEKYLCMLEQNINSQALIEVKLIEVALNQEFRTGIDWNYLNQQGNDKFEVKSELFSSFIKNDDGNTNSSYFLLNGTKGSIFNLFIKSLEQFGSLRMISSPRLTVLNNQTAIIKVAKNDVFFKVNYQTNYLGVLGDYKEDERYGRYKTVSTSEIRTKPLGLIMPLQISINQDKNEVIVSTQISVSRKVKSVQDPAVNFNARENGAKADEIIASNIPVVESREINTIMCIPNGHIGILGGLMECRSKDDKVGPPGSNQIQPVGQLLQAQKSEDSIVELVVLIKVTILPPLYCAYDKADLRLLRGYINDPRPF